MSYKFDNDFVQCVVTFLKSERNDNVRIRLQGTIKQIGSARSAIVSAANPIDRMSNYTGSGLPFPCARIAFENTPNHARVSDPSGQFDLDFAYPNGYYTLDAYSKIEPSIFVTIEWKDASREQTVVRLPLDDPLPIRTLSYRPNYYKGPHYYAVKSDVIGIRGAEATMRALAEAKVAYDIA